MGNLSFTIEIRSKGANIPGDLAALCADLSEPFKNIINAWAEHNAEKFDRSRGAELSGVDQAAGTTWEPLQSLAYARQKRREGYSDWLMVRTGALRAALTSPDGFFSVVTERMAAFGTPNDAEDQVKVAGNWLKRQAVFLDLADKRMIQAHVFDYLSYGAGYLGQKQRLAELKEETALMDVAFAEVAQ